MSLLKLPKRVKPGEPVKATDFNLILDALEMIAIMPGTGYFLKRGRGGTTLDIRVKNGGGGSAAVTSLPLTLKKGTAADKIKIVPGYVNSLMPTLAGTPINSPVSPATTPATPEITVTADTWVWVKCVGTFGSPDTYVITIHTESTDTPPAEAVSGTGFTSYELLGWVDFTSGSPDTYEIVNIHSGGNLGVESFGAVNIWFKK